jgi:hypothetical protein
MPTGRLLGSTAWKTDQDNVSRIRFGCCIRSSSSRSVPPRSTLTPQLTDHGFEYTGDHFSGFAIHEFKRHGTEQAAIVIEPSGAAIGTARCPT